MRSKIKFIRFILLISFIFGFIYNIYIANNKLNSYFITHEELHDLKIINKEINHDLSGFKSKNYDDLRIRIKHIEKSVFRLKQEIIKLNITDVDILNSFKVLEESFANKKNILDEYKSANAILDNSYRNMIKILKIVKSFIDVEDLHKLSETVLIPMLSVTFTKDPIAEESLVYLKPLKSKYKSNKIVIELFTANILTFNRYYESFNNVKKKNISLDLDLKISNLVTAYENYNKQIIFEVKLGMLIFLILLIIVLIFLYFISNILDNKIIEAVKKEEKLEKLVLEMDLNVIFSATNKSGIITEVSQAFCEISGYSREELIGKPHNLVKGESTSKETTADIWKTIQLGNNWSGEIQNKRKDKSHYWISTTIEPRFNEKQEIIGYYSIRQNISAQKELEDLGKDLEIKVIEQTKDLQKQLETVKNGEIKQNELFQEIDKQKNFVENLIDSQEQLIITTDGINLISGNKTFLEFFNVDSTKSFVQKYKNNCICETFNTVAPLGYLQIQTNGQKWIDYVIDNPFTIHKVMITSEDGFDRIFSVTATVLIENELKSAVFTDITEMENSSREILQIHNNIKDSIKYASLIQNALIPDDNILSEYFSDYFTIWNPKDVVGGDIYLFERISNDEVLLMVIDCTGHGVPGAFVTMLVKAIERQVFSIIQNSIEEISPAWILSYFNREIKQLLKQNNIDTISNAGFDGGIIYYNKSTNILKYSGAETPLFYIDENKVLQSIKGSRQSVGYKKSDINFKFKEHIIHVKSEMQFYLTTDGFLDQNGGEKGFPFGKNNFRNLINRYSKESSLIQKNKFQEELIRYQRDEDKNDDITLISFKI